jgi:hypothetical protein
MKRALLVGINYTGTSHALKGCLNDVKHMQEHLLSSNFDEVKTLLETEATTDGIKRELEWLVSGTKPGDVIVFHYSGHGSQLPSTKEPDGFEEIICPIDLDWMKKVITDDDLRKVFDKVPNGVNTTVILDCCHSGTALDQNESLNAGIKDISAKPARKKKGSRYLKPPAKIAKQLADRELVEWSAERDVNQGALLIAGCQANQTSADAVIDGIPQGAATAALLRSVKANPKISYRNLVLEMIDFMKKGKYSQVPELDGSPSLYDKEFLQPFADISAVVEEPVVEQPVEPVVQENGNDKSKIYIAVGVVILILLAIFFSH